MSMRICSPFVVILALAACEPTREGPPGNYNQDSGTKIACAVSGSADFTESCDVERAKEMDVLFLVVRHPDGGIRRFEVLSDGRGLATADGADEALVTMRDKEIEVAVNGDRYRFPANQAENAARP